MSDNSKPTKLGIVLLGLAALGKAHEGAQVYAKNGYPCKQNCNDPHRGNVRPWDGGRGGSNNDYDQKKGYDKDDYHKGGDDNKNWHDKKDDYDKGGYDKKRRYSNDKNRKNWGKPNYFYPERTPVIYPRTPGYGYDPRLGTGGAIYWGFYGNQIVPGTYPAPVPRVYQPAQLVPVGQLAQTSVSNSVIYNPYQPDPTRQAIPLYEDNSPPQWVPDLRTAVPAKTFDQQQPELVTQKLTITPFKGSQNQVFVVKQATEPTAIVSNNSNFRVGSDTTNTGLSFSNSQNNNQGNYDSGSSSSTKITGISGSERNININVNLQQPAQPQKTLFVPISSVLGSSGAQQFPQIPRGPSSPPSAGSNTPPPATSFVPSSIPQAPTQQTSYVPPTPNIPAPPTSFVPENKPTTPQQTTYVPPTPPSVTTYIPQDEPSTPSAPQAPGQSNTSGYLPLPPVTSFVPPTLPPSASYTPNPPPAPTGPGYLPLPPATSFVPPTLPPSASYTPNSPPAATDEKFPANDSGYLPTPPPSSYTPPTHPQPVSYNLRGKNAQDISTGRAKP